MGVHQGQKKLKFEGKIHGQIRIEIAQVRGFGCSISPSRKGRGGKGRTYLVGWRNARRRTGKGGASPLSSPLGKKAAERGSEGREKGVERGEEEGPGNLTFFCERENGLDFIKYANVILVYYITSSPMHGTPTENIYYIKILLR